MKTTLVGSKALLLICFLLTIGCKNKNQDKMIVCWGDSLTEGTGSTWGSYDYPARLSHLTGYTVKNEGEGGESSTQIKTRMLSNPEDNSQTVIIWAGRNNQEHPELVKADIAQMVASLKHKKFLILGIINGDFGAKEQKGGNVYKTLLKLNKDLDSTYGTKYLDVRRYLISKADRTVQDQLDLKHDMVPKSLRSDGIHLNDKGYDFVAQYVFENLKKH